MKILANTQTRLVFRHIPVGLAVIMAVLVLGGIAAGAAAMSMHETLAWTDDFIRIGLGLTLGTVLVGGLVFWRAVRVRRLIFDADADTLRLESAGLGPLRLRVWPLDSVVRAEVAETSISGPKYMHSTRLVFVGGDTESLGAMDPPTRDQIERNVHCINDWLSTRPTRR